MFIEECLSLLANGFIKALWFKDYEKKFKAYGLWFINVLSKPRYLKNYPLRVRNKITRHGAGLKFTCDETWLNYS